MVADDGCCGKEKDKSPGQQPRIRMNTTEEAEGMCKGNNNNRGKKTEVMTDGEIIITTIIEESPAERESNEA